jgi:type IV secretory pathway TraG/TraD family ATPase VirD4
MNDITYFAKTNFRNQAQVFGIRQNDRLLHTYIIGKTGTGKTTLLETMIKQDIRAGHGLCLLDPHGDLVQRIHASFPLERQGNVIYLDIPDQHLKLRYNPFKRVSDEKRSLVASGILEVFKKLWSDAWGVKLEHILRCCILTLLDQPNATLADIHSLLLDKDFRRNAVMFVSNPYLQKFWQKEFVAYTRLDVLPVLNKIGGMLAHPVIRKVLIENPNEIFLRQAIDTGKIILVNLSKGKLGEDVSHLLGALFVSSLSSAAFSRADIPEENRRPFVAYFDEFHNFTTLSLVNMFAELRKFKVGLTLAHQYINQLDDDIRQAIFGNVGTIISFRIGTEDAQLLIKEMYPVFQVEDFINLPNYSIYLKLMIDGVSSKPFSATTIKPLD